MSFCTRKILLEVAVQSVDDAVAAWRGGADRLELCQALQLDGLTPSLGLFLEVRLATPLPVMVMVRHRSGPFVATARDFKAMEREVAIFRDHQAAGVVFGLLKNDFRVDEVRCRRLVELAGPMQTVFHRAFDLTMNPLRTLEQVIEIGCTRVLTSGQKTTALEGKAMIRALKQAAAGRIEVLPGAGIKAANVAELIHKTTCDQVHGSFRGRGRATTIGSNDARGTDRAQVAAVRKILDSLVEPLGV